MTAFHFNEDNFEEKVLKSDKLVLVDFFAEWCGPCRMAEPIIEELAGDYKDKVVIGKINVDESRELAAKYGVMSIPTVIVLKMEKK